VLSSRATRRRVPLYTSVSHISCYGNSMGDVRLAPIEEILGLAPVGYPAAGFVFLTPFAAPTTESTRSIILVSGAPIASSV
jgi:hypothetical protein